MLLFNDFVVIDDNVFSEAKNRIAGINNLKNAAPRQILYRRDEKCRDANQQAQAVEAIPARPDLFFSAAKRNNTQRKNKKSGQVAIPREDGQDFTRLFHIGGVQRQQRIKVRRAVSLAKGKIASSYQRTDAEQRFLSARQVAPEQQQQAGKRRGIKQAKGVAEREVNQQRL